MSYINIFYDSRNPCSRQEVIQEEKLIGSYRGFTLYGNRFVDAVIAGKLESVCVSEVGMKRHLDFQIAHGLLHNQDEFNKLSIEVKR